MSGGSFDYAYSATDLTDLMEKSRQWGELRDAFEDIEADDIAAEIDAMLKYMAIVERRVEVRLKRLKDVAKAMEWWKSCDYSRDQVDAAIARYRHEE